MSELTLVVRRSALLMWLLAVSGVPFIIFGVDILFERRLATLLTDYIYPSERVTAPPFETHDLAWAWVLLVVGFALTTWALKELIAPRRVVHADHHGVSLAVAGPFSAPAKLPWSAVEGFEASTEIDGGGTFAGLRVGILEEERVPRRPWGARWVEPGVLAIAANEWDLSVDHVADQLNHMNETFAEVLEEEHVDAPASATWIEEEDDAPDGPWVRDDAEMAETLTDRVVASDLSEHPDPEEPAESVDEEADESEDE